MGQEVNIEVTEVSLLNDKNTITAEIELELIWENVSQFAYIYINAELHIPIMEGTNHLQLVYALQQEFLVSDISEQTKSVVMKGEFLGKVDLEKEVKGTSIVYGYNKIMEEV